MIDGDKNVFYVFQVQGPQEGGDRLQRRLLLKVLLHDNGLHVLENHGFPHDLEKMSPAAATREFMSLARSHRFEVVNRHDLLQGLHPDLIPDADHPETLPPELRSLIAPEQDGPRISRFSYHREGQPAPQDLEIHGDKVYLDGHLLQAQEVARVMETLNQKKAVLRHPAADATGISNLEKVEPDLVEALTHIRSAVKSGAVPHSALKTLTGQIFKDSMIPSMGNRKAYLDFLSRPRKGVHVHMDGTQFGKINKLFGFDTGNKAIVAMGNAIRSALDESVGRKHAKAFRIGGDEFNVHLPSAEHAAAFGRALRSKLDSIPHLNGAYKFAVGMGVGNDPKEAEESLINAKNEQRGMGYGLNNQQTHIGFHPNLKFSPGT